MCILLLVSHPSNDFLLSESRHSSKVKANIKSARVISRIANHYLNPQDSRVDFNLVYVK